MEDLRYPVGRFDRHAPLPAGGRHALINSLATVPARLEDALSSLTDNQLDTPYREGGWTVRQVTHHLPESHMNAYIRMKWGLTEDVPTIKTYHEERWAELPDGRTAPIAASVELLTAIHRRWVIMLESMEDKDYLRAIRHPELGEMDLLTLLKMYEWHGRHHIAHVLNLRQRMRW